MSNALSNWKISENYKKSNLTRNDSRELCRLWMHLSCVGKYWWLLIMICVMIQWFVVLFSFYYELYHYNLTCSFELRGMQLPENNSTMLRYWHLIQNQSGRYITDIHKCWYWLQTKYWNIWFHGTKVSINFKILDFE